MSLRTHAVIVQPDQWSGAPTDLARLLAPITGSDEGPLIEALSRGPMTIEADLSAAEARALCERLTKLGVPAEIETSKPAPVEPGVVPPRLTVDRARITDEIPRTRRSTMVGFKPMVTDEPEDDGWGIVFPDLAKRQSAPATEVAAEAAPRSLDDLEAGSPPLRGRVATEPLRAQPAPSPPVLPPEVVRAAPPALPTPRPQTPARVEKPKTPITPEGFDATRLSALLPEDEVEQPPYKPTGFDARPEHHPPFALMFAILAPGAGHAFNGDDEEGVALALRFWTIAPWVRSFRQVRDKAERIRTFWAPRPPDGNGVRAFRFVFAWWLSVSLIAVVLAWGIPAVVALFDREPPVEGITASQIESAFESAETRVLSGRVKALDALEKASADLVPDAKFTMTDEERAERLFVIGYLECKRRSYSMCEAMMKRVLQLRPAYGSAIKLQAWASVSRHGRPSPMPDVGEVPTLDQLEMQKMRDELILQGEHVPPPPPDPGPRAPDEESAAVAEPGVNVPDAGSAP